MKVQAVLSLEVGGRLVVDALEIGEPGPTHIVVKQFATGVCHSQLHQIHNPALPRPLVLRHESTGVVMATGRDVTHADAGTGPPSVLCGQLTVGFKETASPADRFMQQRHGGLKIVEGRG